MKKLEFKNTSIGYNNKVLINEFSLVVDEPKIIAVIGKNGVGKSTLISTLLKIQNPISGSIFIGLDSFKDSNVSIWNKNFGVFFPNRHMPSIKVYEALLIGLNSNSLTNQDDYVISEFEINHLLSKKLNTLSSGELQKVFVAKAFLGNASYVLLDEPLSHLDWEIKNDILLLLPQLSSKLNKTVIIVSHDIINLLSCADDIWFIYNNTMYQDKSVKALIKFDIINKLIGYKYTFDYRQKAIKKKDCYMNNTQSAEVEFLTNLWNIKNPENRISVIPESKQELLQLI